MIKDIAEQIIRNIVAFNKYECNGEAEQIAKFCQMVTTGAGEGALVQELRPHETPEQKAQRERLYHSLSQYAANKVLNYPRRLKSVEDVRINYIGFTDDQKTRLIDTLATFYDEKSVLSYVIEQYVKAQGNDPNGLMLLGSEEVYDDNGVLATRRIMPTIIPNSKVVKLSQHQGVINYGVLKQSREVQYNASRDRQKKTTQMTVNDLYLYADDLTMIFIRDTSDLRDAMEIDVPPFDLQNQSFDLMKVEKESGEIETYRVYTYEQTGAPCPLVMLSGRETTNDDVKTSILLQAKPQFLELISRVSELGVAISCHIFPQKWILVPECDNVDTDGNSCDNGHCGTKVCHACKGTGKKFHISGQDVITVIMPRNSSPQEIPDLSKMVHFAEHDQFSPIFLKEQIADVLARISDAIFETNIFAGTTVNAAKGQGQTPQNGQTETATKTLIDWQKLYLSLKADSEHVEKITSLIAKFQAFLLFGANKGKVSVNFPKDFKFMTLGELMIEYKNAVASGLPYEVSEKILSKIIEKQSPDDALKMMWALMKLKHKPFSDKSAQEIAAIIQSRAFDDFERGLWEGYDSIFDELMDENPSMVALSYKEQRSIIKDKTLQYISETKEMQGNDLNAIFNGVQQ